MSDERLKLSASMKRHLRELSWLGPDASWGPESSGEWRCAEALERRGLLTRNVSHGVKPYTITADGLRIGQALAEREGEA